MGRTCLYLQIIVAINLLCLHTAFSQQPDTTDLYYRLHKKADKHKVTRWIYQGIFRNPIVKHDTFPPKQDTKKTNAFSAFQGKVIRHIEIVSMDPFGFSVNDTLKQTPNNIERLGNKYHINTRKYIIRNILLFKPNKKLDPLEISESERLIRLYPYVNDARIYVSRITTGSNADSVDITVMVQDKWSAIIGSSFDVNNPNIKIVERNLFGLGHQLEQSITHHNSDGTISTSGKYTIFNTGNTFINSSVFYSTSPSDKQWGVAFDRPFYSALAKWAGGASYIRNYSSFNIIQNNEGLNEQRITYPIINGTEDIWVAKNFPTTHQKTASINKRSDNYVVGLRYNHLKYAERPPFTVDTNQLNRNQMMILNNIGFSKRKYYKDRYLFRFGANEDIPEGHSIEYVQGFLNKEASSTWYYAGVKLAAGKHYDHFGYLSAGISYGTFYNRTFIGAGVVNVDAYYFSDLFVSGKWFFRQFSRCQYTQGIDRLPYESININGKQMYGFSSDLVTAKSKMILNLEVVMYAPYEFIGFKFAPVLMCGFAKTGNGVNDLLNSYTYQAHALGILIRNEHLITSTFEISIGLYPYVPGKGDYLLKLNPVGSYNIKARDYNIGKPELVPYQ